MTVMGANSIVVPANFGEPLGGRRTPCDGLGLESTHRRFRVQAVGPYGWCPGKDLLVGRLNAAVITFSDHFLRAVLRAARKEGNRNREVDADTRVHSPYAPDGLGNVLVDDIYGTLETEKR